MAKGRPSPDKGRSGSAASAKPTGQTPSDAKRRKTASKTAAARSFPIVGIGASAGGLEAFKGLLSKMPTDTGMAFVLVQHLDPSHESLMVDLLSRCTEMPVLQISNKMAVKPNHVYFIPPNTSLSIHAGKLQLGKPVERRGMRMPIDYFFRSLAEDQHEKAIGIVLSGTGTDGTLGLRAIKEMGGLTIVQNPKEAAYDGMPRSAIDTGLIDYVLSLGDIPVDLVRYVNHFYMSSGEKTAGNGSTSLLNNIIALLQARVSCNFHYYKKNTLVRRIERRMGLKGLENLDDYLDLLRTDGDEVQSLYKDLLISVTAFFRDSRHWDELKEQVLVPMVDAADSEHPLRVWIPGCATGEEAYTLSILLHECFQAANKQPNLQVFATDVDVTALDFGRAGVYPESIAADVSPERLKQFFIKEGQTYQVNKQLRESVVFAVQNLIADPPFSKLDLISCRNLLIYIESEVQKKLMPLFHFALKENGVLFLGPSETIGRESGLFETISKHAKIYQRIGATRRNAMDFPIFSLADTAGAKEPGIARAYRRRDQPPAEIARKALLNKYAPPSVLIDRKFHIHYFYGETGQFLDQPIGEPTQDLMALAQTGIRTKVRSAVHKVAQQAEPIAVEQARIKEGNVYRTVRITVMPVDDTLDGMLVVSFEAEEKQLAEPAATELAFDGNVTEEAFRQLETELYSTREDLQSTIEEMETANEELKASNEEAMSMNEELQSTNEELETSKEELQSLNEELSTVNNQLQDKVDELEHANNDFANLLNSTDIATVFLDTQFRIKRFTPASRKLLNLIPTDIGRPFGDISHKVANDGLLDSAERVLETLKIEEHEVVAPDGRWYLRRILPYRTSDNRIEGVVIIFADITEMKKAAEILEISERRLSEAQRIAHMGNWEWDIVNDKLWWSDEIYRIFGIDRVHFGGSLDAFLGAVHPDDLEFVRRSIDGALYENRPYSIDHRIRLSNGSEKFVHEQAEVSFDSDGKPTSMKGTVLDITARAIIEHRLIDQTREMKAAKQEAEDANRAKSDFLSSMSHELRTPLNAVLGFAQMMEFDPTEPLNEKQKARVSSILEGGRHLLNVVNDVLDLSGIESGGVSLSIKPVNCASIIDPCLLMAKSMGRKFGVTVESETDASKLPTVMADVTRSRQALLNLLSNAVKYNKKGGQAVLSCEAVNDRMVRFKVSDSGWGIPEQKFSRLFAPFDRLDTHHSGDGVPITGTGIGLTITKELVERMGGSVGFESSVGKGSVFWFELPTSTKLPGGMVLADEAEKDHFDLSEAARLIKGPKRVVYMESDPANIDLMEAILGAIPQLTMMTTVSGKIGLDIIAREKPDLVLVSMELSDMSAIDVCSSIKRHRKTAHIPVIALGESDKTGKMPTASQAGFERFIVQPLRIPELLDAVATALRGETGA